MNKVKKSSTTNKKTKTTKAKKVKETHQKDQLSLYYDGILKKVDKLLKEDKLQEALDLVNDELDSPYIPSEYLVKFEDLSTMLSAEVKYLKDSTKYESLQRNELFIESFKNNNINTTSLSIFLQRYKDDLEMSEIKQFDSLFSSKNFSMNSKLNLFLLLKSIQFDYEFDFYNVFLNKMFKLRINEMNSIFDSKYFISLREVIENFTFKEPSLNEFCNLIVFQIYVHNFPNTPDFEVNDLAYGIFQYMLNSLQGGVKEYKNPEIINYIETIIELMEKHNKN